MERPRISPWLAVAAMSALLAGCASNTITPGTRFVVKNPGTPFYKYGPAQSFGPDFKLEGGTPVTIVERSWGFSRVMTTEGITGYVANDEIEIAPFEPKPAAPAGGTSHWLGLPSFFGGAPKRESHVAPTPGDPLFDVNDVPSQPTAEDTHEKPKPSFRYPKPKPPFRY